MPGEAFSYDPSLNTLLVGNFEEIIRYNLINTPTQFSCKIMSSTTLLRRSKWDMKIPFVVDLWFNDHKTILQFDNSSELLEIDYTVHNATKEEYPDSGDEDEPSSYSFALYEV